MKFNITFLGTGQGIPTASRNHISIFVNVLTQGLLFDCGEGTQRQFRKAGISHSKIDRIFISHWHGDHVLGLPGLLQTMSLCQHNRPLVIYGPKGTKKNVEEMLLVFAHRQNFSVNVVEVSKGVVWENDDVSVECASVSHTVPCLAFSIVVKDKLRIDKKKLAKLNISPSPLIAKLKDGKDVVIYGKKVKSSSVTYPEDGLKVSIVFDTRPVDSVNALVKDSDLLICESTYGDSEEDTALEYAHMTSRQAAQLAKKSHSKKLLLTHFSQRYDGNELELLRQAREVFKDTQITNDLDSFQL
jgi:ribonuclease Z